MDTRVQASPAAGSTDALPVTLHINGMQQELQVEPWVSLLDLLRERLHLRESTREKPIPV